MRSDEMGHLGKSVFLLALPEVLHLALLANEPSEDGLELLSISSIPRYCTYNTYREPVPIIPCGDE